jgi:hypothetical protein
MAINIGPGINFGAGISVMSEAAGYATGGTITDITGYKVHTFNSSGTFATTASWPSGRTIEYLVIGGGGGTAFGAEEIGGGGGGGYKTASGVTAVASTNYVVTRGDGGIANGSINGTNGGILASLVEQYLLRLWAEVEEVVVVIKLPQESLLWRQPTMW